MSEAFSEFHENSEKSHPLPVTLQTTLKVTVKIEERSLKKKNKGKSLHSNFEVAQPRIYLQNLVSLLFRPTSKKGSNKKLFKKAKERLRIEVENK